MLEIKKIRLSELEDFVQSEMFRKFNVVPITQARANSYLQNSRAKFEDVVLYLGFVGDQLVAFRSLFADLAFVGENPIRFAWCSGSWVHPGYRRKGYSKQLLTEAYSDWDKKLMFTNYAPESEQLYIETGWFHPIHQYKGVRCYLFPKTEKLLSAASKNALSRITFKAIDFIVRIFVSFKLTFFRPTINVGYAFEETVLPDDECYQMVQENKSVSLYRRGKQELEWIFNNPWILSVEYDSGRNYPFSSFSDDFFYRTIKIFRSNKFIGFFIFSVRERHLKTLFFQIEEGLENEIAAFLKQYCVENKLEMATVNNSKVGEVLFKRKFPFLHVKKMGQKIYSTFDVKGGYSFQDGDGDVFFT